MKLVWENYKPEARVGVCILMAALAMVCLASQYAMGIPAALAVTGFVIAFLAQDRMEIDLDAEQVLLYRNLRYVMRPKAIPFPEIECLEMDFFDTTSKTESWRTFTLSLKFKDAKIRPFRIAEARSLDDVTAGLVTLRERLKLAVHESEKLQKQRIEYEHAGKIIQELSGPKSLQ